MGSSAWAGDETNLRQKLFEMDKVAALVDFDTAQKQACVSAFSSRYQSRYALSGALTLNEPFSLAAYDRLFWKGEGSLRRGLIFVGSVTDHAGDKAGSLLCYYAITDYRLDFQSAYVLPLKPEESAAAGGQGNTRSSLITLSSKE
jgi:hypothetical protein